jgi:hypothetical protein
MAERVLEHKGGADLVRVLTGVETIAEQARRLAQEEAPSGGRAPSAAVRQRKLDALRDLRAQFARKPWRAPNSVRAS